MRSISYQARQEATSRYNMWLTNIYPGIVEFVKYLRKTRNMFIIDPISSPKIVIRRFNSTKSYNQTELAYSFTSMATGRNFDNNDMKQMKIAIKDVFNEKLGVSEFYKKYEGCIMIHPKILTMPIDMQRLAVIHEAIHMAGALEHGWQYNNKRYGEAITTDSVSTHLLETVFCMVMD